MREVLAQVEGAGDLKEIIVINKADASDPEVLDRLTRRHKHSVVVSARTGQGIDALLTLIADELPKPDVEIDVLIPYELSLIHI